jgi:hypothetical protein
MKRAVWRTGCALWLALAAGAAARAEPVDPYDVPREQFREQVAHVALRPLALPPGTPDPERVRAEFERSFVQELERRGYTVTASSVFAETWKRFSSDLGGVYDAVTGKVDDKKFDAVWDYTLRELERERGVDAVLVSSIHFDLLPYGADGPFPHYTTAVGEPVEVDGKKFWGRPSMPLRVDASFLGAMILDRAGVRLYSLSVPIRWSRVYINGGAFDRSVSELYADTERNRSRVAILLQQLETRGAAQPAGEREAPELD